METITYKCPGCGAALEFDIKSQLLCCDHCGEMYSPQDFRITGQMESKGGVRMYGPQQPFGTGSGMEGTQTATETGETEFLDESETMEMRIYHCSSCGAELMTNDVEVTKMCSFCGNPTILFDRVARERRPAKIIPFSLTKEAAVEKAREKFSKAKFMPAEIKDISLDSVQAIYLPYYCYNVSLEMGITVAVRKNDRTTKVSKQGTMTRDVLLDASRKFNDDVSRILNPFPVKQAVPFNETFLSGFYADRCDVDVRKREIEAGEYVGVLLQEKLIAQIPDAPSLYMRQQYSDIYSTVGNFFVEDFRKGQLNGSEYYFCPVYFITFRVGHELVILLVNGCTGKVVGNVPIDRPAFEAAQKRNSIICAVIFGIIGALMFRYAPIWWAGALFFILSISIISSGNRAKKTYEKMRWEMSSSSMFDLTKNR